MDDADREHLSRTPMGRHLLDTGHHPLSESIGVPWHCHVCPAHGDTPTPVSNTRHVFEMPR